MNEREERGKGEMRRGKQDERERGRNRPLYANRGKNLGKWQMKRRKRRRWNRRVGEGMARIVEEVTEIKKNK